MIQAIKIAKVAIYCRVSTTDQDSSRQESDLRAYAQRAGYEILQVFHETASGAKNDRAQRAKIIELARGLHIDAILVTELSRWGRSTEDLLSSLRKLADWNVSIIAQSGIDLNLSTATGKLMLTVMSGIAEFERDLLRERTLSGLARAKAKGKKLGRQVGQNPSDKYAKKVLHYLADGKTVRWIAQELHISTTTVQAIKRRTAEEAA
jgi:putative DNA-invertase from lambdoid prophage Rac